MTAIVPNTDSPAKWSKPILDLIGRLVDEETRRVGRRLRVCDPMAGVGRTHDLDADTFTGDIEPEWAACRRPAVCADAVRLPFPAATFDCYVTSPTYANRLADSHDNRDTHKACVGAGCRGCKGTGVSPRKGYKFSLGRDPHPDSTATLHWGEAYRAAHERIWGEAHRVVRPGGLVVVNVSNHVRGGEVVPVFEWHVGALRRAGFAVEDLYAVPTRRFRDGANREARVAHEHVIVLRNPTGCAATADGRWCGCRRATGRARRAGAS